MSYLKYNQLYNRYSSTTIFTPDSKFIFELLTLRNLNVRILFTRQKQNNHFECKSWIFQNTMPKTKMFSGTASICSTTYLRT